MFGAYFWCEFFPTFGLNMETYRLSPRIHSECGVIWARPTLNANTFHEVDVRTLLQTHTHTYTTHTYIHTCNHETTMCLPTYHHSGFMATHALRHMICRIHTRHIVFMIACILCPSCFCEIVRFVHSICLGSLINIKTKINTYDITYISQLSNKRS